MFDITTMWKVILVLPLFFVKCLSRTKNDVNIFSDTEEFDINIRSRRQTAEVNRIQVLFVTDYAVYAWFSSLSQVPGATPEENKLATERNITRYYAYVFNRTSIRYEGISDLNIQLEFSGLIITKNFTSSYWTTSRNESAIPGSLRGMVPAKDTLEDFEEWINETKSSLPQYDHVILFTGYNLTYSGSAGRTGLSRPDALCKSSSISVVEDTYDGRTALVVAQEIGRALGARLDLDGNTCLSFQLYIMTPKFKFPSATYASNLWKFSTCSIKYFKDFIDSLSRNCLTDTSGEQYPERFAEYFQELPGEAFDADEQCRLVYGTSSYVCRALITDYNAICRGLSCFVPETQGCELILPEDGTLCGNRSVCDKGKCTASITAAEVPDKCPFGDQPLPFNNRCPDLINARPFDCYLASRQRACCQSCITKETGATGCEYGDKIGSCAEESCSTYDEEKRTDDCCLTCNPEITTKLITTTTTAPTTPAPTTTTTAVQEESTTESVTSASTESGSTIQTTETIETSSVASETTETGVSTEDSTTQESTTEQTSQTDSSMSTVETSTSVSSTTPSLSTVGTDVTTVETTGISSTVKPDSQESTSVDVDSTTGSTISSGTTYDATKSTSSITRTSTTLTTTFRSTTTTSTTTDATTTTTCDPTDDSSEEWSSESAEYRRGKNKWIRKWLAWLRRYHYLYRRRHFRGRRSADECDCNAMRKERLTLQRKVNTFEQKMKQMKTKYKQKERTIEEKYKRKIRQLEYTVRWLKRNRG